MLTIRAAQLQSLDDHALREFASEIRPALAEKYPHCLPAFPVKVQERIVLNMLGRAGHWGITWQTARLAFAEMMFSVAPNFDDLHDIQMMLRLEWLVPNRAMLCVNPQVTAKSWKAARLPEQNLPLFVPPEQIGSSPLDQTAAALSVALGDKISGANPRLFAESALWMVDFLELGTVPDAGLVVAAWRLFYGRSFRDQSTYPWLADVFGKKRSPAAVVSMLRFRIRLDHGRFV